MAEESRRRKGRLIIIGGGEARDTSGKRLILREVARHIRGGKLVLAAVARHRPEGYFDEYQKAFADLDLGLDEDSAAIVEGDELHVIGSGAVCAVDGTDVSYCNVAEARSERSSSMHDVRVHVLSDGDGFDLKTRRPIPPRERT